MAIIEKGGNVEHHMPTSKMIYDINKGEHHADFRIVKFYINNTQEDICVTHRNNLPIVTKGGIGGFCGTGEFIVRTVYHFNGRDRIVSTINAIQAYKKKFKLIQPDLEILLKALLISFDNDKNLSISDIGLDKVIPIRTLKDNSSIYIPEEDIMLSNSKSILSQPHPYSDEGAGLAACHELVKQKKVSGVFIELIDNENTVKKRFMHVAKQLIEVPSRTDVNKKSGVYFTKAESDRMDEVHLAPEFYTIAEAEEQLGLYKTREEAMTGGNPEVISRIEEDRVKKELTELQRTVSREKIETEREQNEAKRVISALELENENKKIENTRLKESLEAVKATRTDHYEEKKAVRSDYYEDRTYVRKDTHEMWKMGAVAITAGLGVYAVLTKSRS